MSINGNTEAKKSINGKVTVIPTIDKTLSKSGYSADAKVTGDALKKKVNTSDIVDNLTTNADNKPLSAKQGAELKRRIDDIDPHFAENVIYDNENGNFESKDVQGALDEISSRLTPTAVKTKNSSVKSDGVGEVLLSITDRNDNGHERYISISDKTKKGFLADSLKYVEKDGNNYAVKNIFGEHNKPTGSYTGNGSTATRTIDIGGVGGWLGVCCGSYMIGIITQNGAMFFNTTNSTVKCFPVAQAKYMSGVLTLASADTFLNGNGNIYYYQVL